MALRVPFLLPLLGLCPLIDSLGVELDRNILKKSYFAIFTFLLPLNTCLIRYLLRSLSLNSPIPEAIRNLLNYSLSMPPDLSRSQSLNILLSFYCLAYMCLHSIPNPKDPNLCAFSSITLSSALPILLLLGIDSP